MEQQKFLGHWIALFCTFCFLSPFFCESFDYRNALSKSLLYFEAQRSGALPPNQRVKWRYHSGLRDGLEQGVDLVGGYYDAGDNVKFGLPMAFTITMLSWSVMQYQQEIANAGEYEHALDAIKWGTDYFIKAHSKPHVLWAQVGDGYSDHRCWQRPEDMTTSRRAYKVDEKNPGSDVAGETAAAMAAASIVFKETNPQYSHLLLYHAEQLFEFADNYRGQYDISIPSAKHFYRSSSGYKDELLWAAIWLYKATGNREYLHYAIENANSFGGSTWEVAEFSWDIKYAGVQALAAMLQEDEIHEDYRQIMQQYRSKANHYMCACLNKTASANVQRTPGGLLYTREWNNLQYVTAATFLLMAYSENLHAAGKKLSCKAGDVSPAEMFNFAKSQVNYILGYNPKGVSYLVGYGTNFPKRVHHRGASIKAKRKERVFVGCTEGYEKWYDTEKPNPHVLVGAVVGGPDENDEFNDHRDYFRQTEACTYNTAPLVGVFARLNDLESGLHRFRAVR